MQNKVKTSVASALAAVAGVGASHAADAVVAHDWTGPYIGGSVGIMSGSLPWGTGDGSDYALAHDPVFAGFAGYNKQFNDVVMGAEIALQSDVQASTTQDDYNMTWMGDAKFKVGKVFGEKNKYLGYGFVGASMTNVYNKTDSAAYSAYGANFGGGVEYAATDNLTLGAEVVIRRMKGYDETQPSYRTNDQLSLRAAFHF